MTMLEFGWLAFRTIGVLVLALFIAEAIVRMAERIWK